MMMCLPGIFVDTEFCSSEKAATMLPSAVVLLFALLWIDFATANTNETDWKYFSAALLQWQNKPSNWTGPDPCGSNWLGVYCDYSNNSRITSLYFSAMRLKGPFPEEIGYLTELTTIDFSYNRDLSGPIPKALGNLKGLQQLILKGCSFSSTIPEEIGGLTDLQTLDLGSNQLTGSIPKTFGNLTELYWLDITNNSISGTIPVELQHLHDCRHFHFSNNKLNGNVPTEIFSEDMDLWHILFDNNSLIGEIPATIGFLRNLIILKLDHNFLQGVVPANISKLANLQSLYLSNNNLSGRIPDLSGMQFLQLVELGKNQFSASSIPTWFYTLNMTAVKMDNTQLNGTFPSQIFSLTSLETLILNNNSIDGYLPISGRLKSNFKEIDLRFNDIDGVPQSSGNTTVLLLEGNPLCNRLSDTLPVGCNTSHSLDLSYSTDRSKCGNVQSLLCSDDNMEKNPITCECQLPLKGIMIFRALSFLDLQGADRFKVLEDSFMTKLNLTNGRGAVYICCMYINDDNALVMELEIFPPNGTQYFDPSDVWRIATAFGNVTYVPPYGFGPYILEPYIYITPAVSKPLSKGIIIGIVLGGILFFLVTLSLIVWVYRLKKRFNKSADLSYPFASWGIQSGTSVSDTPKLKVAKLFSLEELKLATSKFSESNLIGSGGYGKVYRGCLQGGDMIAVKRANKETMVERWSEFKTELELLSRVHHKNLVVLTGFCFEENEKLLVYEYMANGSLSDNLYGKTGICLNWKRRLRIALGAATGLMYLHEHADPPIIHRDVKSSNILLDENMVAKVSDFGLCKLIIKNDSIQDRSSFHMTTDVKGTLGYIDPEYYQTQQITKKSDVFSFGVVLLEMVAARPPLQRNTYLVREMRRAMESPEGISEVKAHLLDPYLRDMSSASTDSMEKLVKLGLWCTEERPENRPKMGEVVQELEFILECEKALLHDELEADTVPDLSESYYRRKLHLIRSKPSCGHEGSGSGSLSPLDSSLFSASGSGDLPSHH